MNAKELLNPRGHIIFDHDGTLVNTDGSAYTLFVGVKDLLIELKALEFELYIWTARPRRSVIESITKLEIASFFTDIYCYDDGLPKPYPDGLKKLTDGISKKDILHIGDSLTDIDGAHNYGIEVVAACWNNPNDIFNYQKIADYTAIDASICLEIIKGKFYV
jgi:phosphoglycolate phosphatase